jgi:antitoxin (DNA-binding transcriptional repressor) of toxin-antitoxin stability system
MKQVNIHEAKTQLSKLIQLVLEGEEVIIARDGEPLVRLEVLRDIRHKRRIGGAKGLLIHMAEDFDDPIEDFKDYTT